MVGYKEVRFAGDRVRIAIGREVVEIWALRSAESLSPS
jgi:hypothetical protein